MKLQISKGSLSEATQRMQGAIVDRNMAHISLKAEGHLLHMSANDRVISVYNNLECQIEKGDTLFVPAKLFSDVVKELPEGAVILESDPSFLVISAAEKGKFTMKIPLISDLIWNERPVIKVQEVLRVRATQLSYLIDQVQYCIMDDSPRNYGVVGYLHVIEPGKLRLVGTDGFRLSVCDVEVDSDSEYLKQGVCLSKRGIQELARMCGSGHEFVNLSFSEDRTTLLAEVPDYQVFIRLSAVKYPNYAGVLPRSSAHQVELSRNYVHSVSRRVLLAADRKTRALQLSFSESSLTLSSKTMGSSEGKENIYLEDYHGPDCRLVVNGRYFTDVISVMGSSDVRVSFSTEEDPILLLPIDEPPGCHSKHVLVPIKEAR